MENDYSGVRKALKVQYDYKGVPFITPILIFYYSSKSV